MAAFKMRADLLQRYFLLHFWVIEGVSRYYPNDINDFMQRLINIGPDSPDFQPRMNEWVVKQADLFPRILHYYEKAKAQGRHRDAGIKAIINCFSQHVKLDFMEEMVSFGQMTPTMTGLREFIAGLPADEQQNIERHYLDPDKVKPFQRKAARKRWIQYRRDLLKNVSYKKAYEQIDSLDVPPESPVAIINDHTVTLADFLAIYGPIPNDVNWNNIKRSRINKLILAYAMGDEADRLGVLPDKFQSKISLTKKLYLAADRMVRDIGPLSINDSNPTIDFQFFRRVIYFPNLMKFEKAFISESQKIPAFKKLWIDKEYLAGLTWIVAPAYTPEQATYF